MRTAIAVDDRDAHLRHHLGQPGIQRLQHLMFRVFGSHACRSLAHPRLQCQPRADHSRAISNQHRRMMNIAAISGLHGNTSQRTQTAATNA